ncbi:XrtA system polysaccharide chain length determinant [Frateuria terrea]|uniref:Polysaccharide chain length determinant protein, PEP-CTERM locus subfamily n=1 Tax=Frateuria terrea TaxID=529704 RepID=A0A1H6VEX8_9GAMM|nr:XrtA system polysaccharide chain length determinant [Frateuria terrea]SEJ03131.1 polysaccharide chain length determinant protein, PEP-CTERM locus subfamily [Frateuria terrea]SFP64066.1 polysaccharide chain length determinant protein, PEP-CTERM locus subfamily [Frateuria terrea]
MNEQPTSLQVLVPILVREAGRHRLALGGIFAAIALAALVAGLLWPKKYVASTTILVQEKSIITPLMEGAATPTGNADRAGIARAVILGNKVIEQVLEVGGWAATHPTPVQKERIIEDIKARTSVQFSRDNLLTISYFDSDPRRAYLVTRKFGQMFISESLASKQRESREAFEFIDSQVEAYRRKLTGAENKLKAYREANADARPGSDQATLSRINDLRAQVENTRMDLMEKRSQEASLVAQLSGESEVTAVQTTEGVYRAQLAELQAQLDKLLLSYTAEYPDVVRVRHQMEDVQQQLAQAEQRKQAGQAAGTPTALESHAQFNPLYQQLKSRLSALRGDLAATSARLGATEAMLRAELERSKHIAESANVTSELTRDYDVNRDVYQDLLKRRENARVSMNLEARQRGLTFVVQNPAAMPLVPSGLRFMHFGLAGMILALAVPFGLLFGIARYDPRIRSAEQLEHLTGVTTLATVPYYSTFQDRRRQVMQNGLLALIVLAVFTAYLVVFWLKLRGHA